MLENFISTFVNYVLKKPTSDSTLSNILSNDEMNDTVTLKDNSLVIVEQQKSTLLNTQNSDTEMVLQENVAIEITNCEPSVSWGVFENELLMSANMKELYPGNISETEETIREMLNVESIGNLMQRLNSLALKHFGNPIFICSILHSISHMEYEEIYPIGPTIALAALSNKSDSVIEYAIRAFENWNNKTSLTYMKAVEPKTKWVYMEWMRVIEYIEKNGDEIVELFDEDDWIYETVVTTA